MKKSPIRFIDSNRTKQLQKDYQSYGRGGVIIALVVSIIVIIALVFTFL